MSKPTITKRCSDCKQTKSVLEFVKNRSKKDGYGCLCKPCNLKRTQKYYQTEKGKANRKRYQQSKEGKLAVKRYRKTEKGKACIKHFRHSKKGKILEKRYNHKKESKAARKRYHISHPEYRESSNLVKNAITAGKLPRPDTLKCHYCPEQAEQYHHYLGYEPEHRLDVVPVCRICHNKIHQGVLSPKTAS